MTTSKALFVAIGLAERKRDAASQFLAGALHRHGQACRQMDELVSYATDTRQRWSIASRPQTSPQIMGHSYQFIERLEQTIALQRSVVVELEGQCQAARNALLQADVRLAGLQRLLDRQRGEQARTLARQEQRRTDEFAARAYFAGTARVLHEDES